MLLQTAFALGANVFAAEFDSYYPSIEVLSFIQNKQEARAQLMHSPFFRSRGYTVKFINYAFCMYHTFETI